MKKKIIRLKILFTCLFLSWYYLAVSQEGPRMVRDINPLFSKCTDFINVNGVTFFIANDGNTGYELWKTDGTETGTVLVKDIYSGIASCFYSVSGGTTLLPYFTNINGTLYFVASNNTQGYELWKSDGTTEGTVMVKNINQNSSSYPKYLTNVNGTLFFVANDGINGTELWKSDGTELGTVLVKDIDIGGPYTNYYPSNLTNFNGILYFSANDGVNGEELWKSDGTQAGTVMVKNINNTQYNSYPSYLTVFNGMLYFQAVYGTGVGPELWKSDGTNAGTVLVKSFINGAISLKAVGSSLYFYGGDGTAGLGLWKSDGTTAGTTLIKNVSNISDMTDVNGTLYFKGTNGTNGLELWKSDGTTVGTSMVKDIFNGSSGSDPVYFQNVNGTLYFTANDGINGHELWKSDGSAAGTTMVKDIFIGWVGWKDSYLTNVNGTLYFTANDGIYGHELWKSDGSTAGTVMVKDICKKSAKSNTRNFTFINGKVYFVADDFTDGTQIYPSNSALWVTDGTTFGTSKLTNNTVQPPASGSGIETIKNVNGILYFSAKDNTGDGLWKSNGTIAGTNKVKNITAVLSSSIGYNGLLFFNGFNSSTGYELWKSDGTESGTVMVKDIYPGTNKSSSPQYFTEVNGTLFFMVQDAANSYSLWKSDGTTAGTVLVKTIFGGTFDYTIPTYFSGFTNVNGTLFFAAYNGTNGIELWKSDGTANGTNMVKDISPGFYGPTWLTNFNGQLYFIQSNGSGQYIWKSDGTAAGTVIVPGSYTNLGGYLTVSNNFLFFTANNTLWKTDGISMQFFNNVQTPQNLVDVNGVLYFSASEPTSSNLYELWKSDGTVLGTNMIQNINPNTNGSSNPYNLQNMNGILYFVADDGLHDFEPWAILPPLPDCPSNLAFISPADDISTGTITKQASATSGTITATNKITGTSNVVYQAKNIQLNAGFKADSGTVFKAEIGGCQ